MKQPPPPIGTLHSRYLVIGPGTSFYNILTSCKGSQTYRFLNSCTNIICLGCLDTGTLSKSSGNFSGPRAPFNSETLCTWLIKASANDKIELSFKYSSVSDRDCSFGYVEVYDGDSPTKTSFGRFCEHYWWQKIKSTGSSLYITLWVDSTIKSNGVPLFQAAYSTIISENNSGKTHSFSLFA